MKIWARLDQGTAAAETAVCDDHREESVSIREELVDCTGNDELSCVVCGSKWDDRTFGGWDDRTFGGESFTTYWQRQLDLATERAVAAAEDSVKAAVLLLAYGARECLPEAKRVNLSESDQGEWLWVDDIDGIDQSDESQPVLQRSFDDHYGPAASCLYLAHLDASPYLHADLDEDGTDNGRYYIDIQEALA